MTEVPSGSDADTDALREPLPSLQVAIEPALVLQVKVLSTVPAAARVPANPDWLVTVILNDALST